MNDRLTEIVADVLDLDPAQIDDELTPEDAELWDSLNHLRLVTAVEQEFGVKLSMQEIESIKSLAILRALVAQRT